jgi:hypothetical protein
VLALGAALGVSLGSVRRCRDMRNVIDSNYLQHRGLRAYLDRSRNNFAVLTDYAWMEAYKGDTITQARPNMIAHSTRSARRLRI